MKVADIFKLKAKMQVISNSKFTLTNVLLIAYNVVSLG